VPFQIPALHSELVLSILEGAAVLTSAIAGMILASDRRMDIVGAFALACVNAFGGGTVRDLLLDNRPFYWVAHWEYLLAILLICVPFVYSARMFRIATEVHRRSVKMDAVGLALFTVAGTGVAIQHHAPLIVAPLMGVVTGTAGGVLRDVVVNEVPDLFRPGALYATASFFGALAFMAALEHGLRYGEAAIVGVLVVMLLRLASLRLGVTVPRPQWLDDQERRPP
jgi:uncharacterized membrane protein YeiH